MRATVTLNEHVAPTGFGQLVQLTKPLPEFAVAINVMALPESTLAVHVLPQLMAWVGLVTTPGPDETAVIGKVVALIAP